MMKTEEVKNRRMQISDVNDFFDGVNNLNSSVAP